MSTFKIYPDTLIRLAKVVGFFEPNVSQEVKSQLQTVRLENKNGKCLAIATNVKIAVAEYIGPTTEPDSVCHVKLKDELMDYVRLLQGRNEMVVFTTIPEIGMSTAQVGTGGGFIGDVCYWFDSTPLNDWNSWFVEPPKQSSGIMCWDVFHVEALLQASPSGKVVFPEFINADRPVLLRDRYESQTWYGVFLPSDKLTPDLRHEVQNCYMPDWLKK